MQNIQILKCKNKIPFILIEVENHHVLKDLILSEILEMGQHSNIDKHQKISNSDWFLPKEFFRSYFNYIEPVMKNVCHVVKETMQYKHDIKVDNYWFQQYEYGDYHNWHAHGGALFSCVYYVDIDDKMPKTSFKLFDDEFEIGIKEGSVLVFPPFLNHCSKPNKSKKTKTVIAFNLL